MATALRVGLTGGIGSGKSTVAACLADLGASVIDADQLAKACTAAGGAAMPAIAASFGPTLLDASGALDRDAMRALAFKDAGARARLEAIVHPCVGAAIALAAQQAEAEGSRCLVFDIPLLVEAGRWRSQLARILVVDCQPETQIQRVMQRNGLARPDVERILAAQASREQRLHAADAVLYNDGLDLPALARLVQQIGKQFGL